MLHNADNSAKLDNSLIASASRVLQERLPPGWTIKRVATSNRAPRLCISAKDGSSRELPVSVLSRPDPRAARQIPEERPLLVTASYLSRGVREAIEDEGASYVDQTGNVRVVLDKPGLSHRDERRRVEPLAGGAALHVTGDEGRARRVCPRAGKTADRRARAGHRCGY